MKQPTVGWTRTEKMLVAIFISVFLLAAVPFAYGWCLDLLVKLYVNSKPASAEGPTCPAAFIVGETVTVKSSIYRGPGTESEFDVRFSGRINDDEQLGDLCDVEIRETPPGFIKMSCTFVVPDRTGELRIDVDFRTDYEWHDMGRTVYGPFRGECSAPIVK